MKRVDTATSEVLSAMRMPITLVVLFSHCVLIRANVPAECSLSSSNLFLMSELLFRSLGTPAVAYFALVSGYFFWSKPSFGWQDYRTSLQKRFWSLLIPYIIWNTLFALGLWGKNALATLVGFAPGIQEAEIAMLRDNSWLNLMLMPIDHPLWYIEELIYITVLSPIVWLTLRYLGRYALPVWIVLSLLDNFDLAWAPRLVSSLFSDKIGLFFFIGAYLRYHDIELVALCRRLRWFGILGSGVYLVEMLFFNHIPLAQNLHMITTSAIVVLAINIHSHIRSNRVDLHQRLMHLGDASFFVYALHALVIINLIRGSLYLTPLADNGIGQILIFFITGVVTSVVCLAVYRFMIKVAPTPTRFICGGRA